jgi:membrane protein required for colicin V production
MNLAFQFLDLGVVVVIIASAVLATYRGIVAESLAIFGWIAAAYAAWFLGPWVGWWMRGLFSAQWAVAVAGFVIVYAIVAIPLHFASSRISQNVKKSQIGTFDSVLGTGFGILRGLAVIGIGFMAYLALVPGPIPHWIASARLYPVIRVSAEMVSSLIPDRNVHAPSDVEQPNDQISDKLQETAPPPSRSAAPAPQRQAAPPPAHPAQPANRSHRDKKTYSAGDRQGLSRLIETTHSDKSGRP